MSIIAIDTKKEPLNTANRVQKQDMNLFLTSADTIVKIKYENIITTINISMKYTDTNSSFFYY